jgi:hypothetical protein
MDHDQRGPALPRLASRAAAGDDKALLQAA